MRRDSPSALDRLDAGLWAVMAAVFARPRIALGGVGVLSVICAVVAALTLSVNTDSRDMLDPELPFRQAQKAFDAAFPDVTKSIVVLVQAPSVDEADAFVGRLVTALEDRSDAIGPVFASAADPYFQSNGLLFLSADEIDEWLNRLGQATALISALKAEPSLNRLGNELASFEELARTGGDDVTVDVLETVYGGLEATITARLEGRPEPLSWRGLFDPDRAGPAQRTVLIGPVFDFTKLQPAKASLQAVSAALDEALADGDWRVRAGITGDPALRAEELTSVSQGIGLSFLVSFIVVAGLLRWALGGWGLTLAAVGVLVGSLTISAALAGMIFGALNLVSVAFVVLLVGLGIDFAIHLGLAYREGRAGAEPREALKTAARSIGAALLLCAITTACAFFAFTPTRFVGIAQLGVIAGLGVLTAFALSVVVVSATAGLIGARPPHAEAPEPAAPARAWVRTARLAAAGVTVALGVLAAGLALQARFDADPMALRDVKSPSVVAFNALFEDPATQPYRLDLVVESLAQAQDRVAELEALAEVDQVITAQSFVPDNQDEKLEIVDFAATPVQFALLTAGRGLEPLAPGAGLARLETELAASETESAAALRRALSQLAGASEPTRSGVERDVFRFWPDLIAQLESQLAPGYVELDDVPSALRARYLAPDGRARLEVTPSGDMRNLADRAAFVDAVSAVAPDAAGAALTVQRAGETISAAMLQATALAGVLATVILLVVTRSVGITLAVLAPLALAGALTAGFSVAFDRPFNYANVIVLPLLIGLGADSGIHLALRARREGAASALFRTSTPRAVVFSAVTTFASFGSLTLSSHRGTASMGELLAAAMLATLLCALLVLPVAMEAAQTLRSARRRA
ncbi:MAG: MMPL family transporter [Maricaulaceae bacterium]